MEQRFKDIVRREKPLVLADMGGVNGIHSVQHCFI